MIYDDLKYREEAHIFADQQKHVKNLVPYETFKAHIEAGDEKQKMIESNLCTAEQIFDQVTVTGLCKACGITTEKLLSMFDGAVEEKPKARTLIIKG